MTAYDQRTLRRDGQQLAYHRYPVTDADTAVILLPAMGVPAGYYRRMAGELTGSGIDVTVADLRGTGDSTPVATRAAGYGYLDLVDDADVLLDEVTPELAGRRILLLGHSLGGHISSLLLSRRTARGQDIPVHGLCLVACGLPYHALYGWRSPFLYGMATSMTLFASVRGHWPGYGFAGRQARGIIRDWAHTVHHGRFVDPALDAGLAGVKIPLLAVTVDGDQYTPPATITRLTDKFTAAEATRFHYSHSAAGSRLDHFRWARHSGGLLPQLTGFINHM